MVQSWNKLKELRKIDAIKRAELIPGQSDKDSKRKGTEETAEADEKETNSVYCVRSSNM